MKKLILLSIMGFAQFVSAQAPVFQDTKGDLSVSNSGTLNYSVSIAVPPSLGGVAPSISLSYGSSNNNGVAGYGWNISGLSAISRVNSRLDLDGKIMPIEGDDLAKDKVDAFSLDGQRLILKKNNFKINGIIEYETEMFSHLKIEAKATASVSNNALSSFKITSPNGSVSAYDGTVVGPYAIKKTVDILGNFVDYIYTGDYISEIKWGRNANVPSAGVDNTIKFIYKNRIRIEYSDLITTPKIADKILDRIEVYTQGKLFRKYVLMHETIMNNYERLKQVQEFNQNNEGANPVVFTYDQSPNQFTNLGYHQSPSSAPLSDVQLSGDFDGDGEIDFIANNQLYFNSIGNSNWYPFSFPAGFNANKKLLAAVKTLQTDGKMHQTQTIAKMLGNKLEVFDKNVLAYSKNFSFPTAAGNPTQMYEGDFNGDGLSEILLKRAINSIQFEYYLLDIRPDGLSPTPNLKRVTPLNLGKNVFVFDVNGDGTEELVNIDNSTKKFIAYNLSINDNGTIVTPKIINETHIPEFEENKQLVWGDFNGDARLDLMIPKAEKSADWFVYQFSLENNKKFEYKNFIGYEPFFQGAPTTKRTINRQYQASDMDKDGRSDFIVIKMEALCVNIATDGDCDRDGRNDIHIYNNIGGGRDAGGNAIRPYFNTLNPLRYEIFNDTPYGPTSALTGDFKGSSSFNIVFIQDRQLWKAKYEKDLRKDFLLKNINEGIASYDIGYCRDHEDKITPNTEVYPNVQIKKITSSMNLVAGFSYGNEKSKYKGQGFSYSGLTMNMHGYGSYGFKKVAKTSYDFYTSTGYIGYTNNIISDRSAYYDHKRIWTITESSPALLGRPFKEWTYIESDHNSESFHGILSPTESTVNPRLLSLTTFDYNRAYQTPSFPNKSDYTKVKNMVPTLTKTKNFFSGVMSTSSITYDAFWNPIKTITNNGISTKTTNLLYFNNPTGVDKNYILGRLLQKNESVTAYNDTRTSEEKVVYTNNLPTKKQTKAHNTDYITEDNVYDVLGNLTQKTVSAPGVSPRITKYEYDATKRFMTKETDADNFATIYSDFNIFGQPTKTTDNNLGIISQTIFDNWGKPTQKTLTGASTAPQVENTTYTKNADGTYTITSLEPATSEESIKQLDAHGRTLKTTTKGFATGTKISKSFIHFKEYVSESEPYFDNTTPTKWNKIELDVLGRPTKQSFHDGRIFSFEYNGLTSTTIDPLKRKKITTIDANGNTVSVKNNNELMQYEYYANNALKSTNYDTPSAHTDDPTRITPYRILTGIDGWGRKTSLLDPSVSTKPYTYAYNNYGEMTAETTPTGTNTFVYSPTGRLMSKTSVDKNTNSSTSYSYNEKGLVTKQTGISKGKNYTQDFVYNSFYQLITQTETTPNLVTVNSFTYDAQGRKLKETTNSKLVVDARINNGSPTIEYGYNAYNGMLDQIKDHTGKVLWKLNTANEQLQAISIYLGNGMTTTNTYDAANYLTSTQTKNATSTALDLTNRFNPIRGVLDSRENKSFAWKEDFTYDWFDRLETWKNPVKREINTYDKFSRITFNNSIGDINYYNPNNAQDRYKKQNISLRDEGKALYKGRQFQKISYDINQNPLKINEPGKTMLDFVYDADGSRTETIFTKTTGVSKTMFYTSDNTVEVEVTAPVGGQPAKYNFMTYLAGDPYDAPMVYRKNYTNTTPTPNTEGVYYLHRDYLGSILAISNSAGATIERRHFDPWGNLSKLQVNGIETKDTNLMLTQRGFTGHEHFYEQDIIHMNGRIYDPKLRMMLSPDINILDPTDSQHFNRYSYALNNPLKYTDPSGDSVIGAILITAAVGALIGGATYAAIGFYQGNFTWNGLAKSMVTSAITSVAFQVGLGALKSVLFPSLAEASVPLHKAGSLANAYSDSQVAMMKLIEFTTCEPCQKAAKTFSAIKWGGTVASGIGGGSGTALTQSSVNYDKLQTGLDLAGIADPSGAIDFANGTGYLARGRFLDAGISYASIIPFLDFLKAGRLAKKGIKLGRMAYVTEVHSLKYIGNAMKLMGKSSESIARTLHGMRRSIGLRYKSLTPKNKLQEIYQRNLDLYGDKLGPSVDYLRNKLGKSWGEIIESASRTGGKDLGF
jgi:RHS repeat-associated protein